MRSAWLPLAALLAGCTVGPVHVHRGRDAGDHLEYLARALAAEQSQREQLWQAAIQEPTGEEATLHRALLRTVSGHSGYDLAAAEVELQALLAQSPAAEVGKVARARLEDVRVANACRHEVEVLKRRLSKVADIEKRLDQERR
jgi:hypothetical protein